jgi:hypothetical protein
MSFCETHDFLGWERIKKKKLYFQAIHDLIPAGQINWKTLSRTLYYFSLLGNWLTPQSFSHGKLL